MDDSVDKDSEGFYVEHKLRHYKQRYNWDCGLSCILMLLDEGDMNHFLDNFEAICNEEGFHQCTWTIDLCYLLKKFGIRHKFYTITMGVHMGYQGQQYYDRILEKDKDRVNLRFQNALSKDMDMTCGSLDLEALIRHLKEGPVILLVDANVLTCDLCKFNKLNFEFKSCFSWPYQYAGHYIILCGYNLRKNKFLYRNPTFRDRLCATSFHRLDKARRSYGTDEDLILIYKDYEKNVVKS